MKNWWAVVWPSVPSIHILFSLHCIETKGRVAVTASKMLIVAWINELGASAPHKWLQQHTELLSNWWEWVHWGTYPFLWSFVKGICCTIPDLIQGQHFPAVLSNLAPSASQALLYAWFIFKPKPTPFLLSCSVFMRAVINGRLALAPTTN